MILVDTSVWVDHFRRPDPQLVRLLNDNRAMLHPFVLGELLLGGVPSSGDAAGALRRLPQPPVATAEEAAELIGHAGLAGTGVGYVDLHVLASARLIGTGRIFSRDKRLCRQAEGLGLLFAP